MVVVFSMGMGKVIDLLNDFALKNYYVPNEMRKFEKDMEIFKQQAETINNYITQNNLYNITINIYGNERYNSWEKD